MTTIVGYIPRSYFPIWLDGAGHFHTEALPVYFDSLLSGFDKKNIHLVKNELGKKVCELVPIANVSQDNFDHPFDSSASRVSLQFNGNVFLISRDYTDCFLKARRLIFFKKSGEDYELFQAFKIKKSFSLMKLIFIAALIFLLYFYRRFLLEICRKQMQPFLLEWTEKPRI